MYRRVDSWYSDFFHEGKRYVKSWGAISKTVAKEKDRKFRTEVLEGKHAQKSRQILFEKFADKYLEAARLNKKPSSAKRNEVSINALKPYFQGKLIGAIHPFMVEQFKKERKEKNKTPATINRDITTLKNMFNKAVEWGYLSHNPIDKVRNLAENNEKMWALSPEEEDKLSAACDARPQKKKYLKDLVLFALHTGMRQSEIFNLKKTHCNLEENYITVVDTKNNENRKVPMNESVREILERQIEGNTSEYVFCNSEDKKITVLTNAFWQAVSKAGLERQEIKKDGEKKKIRFRFHDLRHTFGSRLGMAGVDLKTIMEIMGHKSHKMAMRYQHPTPDHKLNAVKLLDRPRDRNFLVVHRKV